MTHLFYELAKKPEQLRKLREELHPLTQGDWTDIDIRHAPRLNAAINEAMRLHPPVPSGTERLSPKGGVQVGDTFIPGDTEIWIPQYVLGRGEHVVPTMQSSADHVKTRTIMSKRLSSSLSAGTPSLR